MFELGKKMAPVLQLGEELVTPSPSSGATQSKNDSGGSREESTDSKEGIIGSTSEDTTESSYKDYKDEKPHSF